jgi:hypothetical protein
MLKKATPTNDSAVLLFNAELEWYSIVAPFYQYSNIAVLQGYKTAPNSTVRQHTQLFWLASGQSQPE